MVWVLESKKKHEVPKTQKRLETQKYLKSKQILEKYSYTQKIQNFIRKPNPKNPKHPKFYQPKIYFSKIEILPITPNYNRKPEPET